MSSQEKFKKNLENIKLKALMFCTDMAPVKGHFGRSTMLAQRGMPLPVLLYRIDNSERPLSDVHVHHMDSDRLITVKLVLSLKLAPRQDGRGRHRMVEHG
jgi:hypothetical protein